MNTWLVWLLLPVLIWFPQARRDLRIGLGFLLLDWGMRVLPAGPLKTELARAVVQSRVFELEGL